jgi:hypothetical protein
VVDTTLLHHLPPPTSILHLPQKTMLLGGRATSKRSHRPIRVTSQDFIKFWGKIFVFVLLVLIEIHRVGFIQKKIGKLFKTFHYFLKNFFEKTKYQYIIFFLLFKPCKLVCKGMNHKSVIFTKSLFLSKL